MVRLVRSDATAEFGLMVDPNIPSTYKPNIAQYMSGLGRRIRLLYQYWDNSISRLGSVGCGLRGIAAQVQSFEPNPAARGRCGLRGIATQVQQHVEQRVHIVGWWRTATAAISSRVAEFRRDEGGSSCPDGYTRYRCEDLK